MNYISFRFDENLPHKLKELCREKIVTNEYNIGDAVTFCFDENITGLHNLYCVARRDIIAFEDIFLLDHMWTFLSLDEARKQLCNSTDLTTRVANILNISLVENPNKIENINGPDLTDSFKHYDKFIDSIMQQLWVLIGSYSLKDSDGEKKYFYILDEVGCRFHSTLSKNDSFDKYQYIMDGNQSDHLNPADRLGVAFDSCMVTVEGEGGGCYTAVWPVRDIKADERLSCKGVPDGISKLEALQNTLSCFDEDEDDSIEGRPLLQGAHAAAKGLKGILAGRGYSVANACRLLGHGLPATGCCLPVWKFTQSGDPFRGKLLERLARPVQVQEPSPDAAASRDDDLRLLLELFLFGLPVLDSQLSPLLGTDLIRQLMSLHLLHPLLETPDGPLLWQCLVQVSPVATPGGSADLLLLTDTAQLPPSMPFEPVMYIGPDSLGLLHGLAATGIADINCCLDVCAGSGVQGLMAVHRDICKTAVLLEKNSRAVRFSRFNACFNNLESKVTVVLGDAVDGLTVDPDRVPQLVIANPPYIPTNAAAPLLQYGCGGDDGEQVTAAILGGLRSVLAAGPDAGSVWFCMVANLMNVEDYGTKIASWLGEGVSGSGGVLHGEKWSAGRYAELVTEFGSAEDRVAYEQQLRAAGVTDVANGVVILRCAAAGADSQSAVRLVEGPQHLWQSLAGAGAAEQSAAARDSLRALAAIPTR